MTTSVDACITDNTARGFWKGEGRAPRFAGFPRVPGGGIMIIGESGTMKVEEWVARVLGAVESVIRGKREVIRRMLVALLADGHVLIEDVPGVGKTMLARAIAGAVGGRFSRIQCTPDLLPADVLGLSIYNPRTGDFDFRAGPILANVVLVDEINRATPRTQAAMLEAMGEGQVTIEGQVLRLPEPFFLIATENPVEFEGTFPLPEAQRDRFLLATELGYADRRTERELLDSLMRPDHPVRDLTAVTTAEEVLEARRACLDVFLADDCAEYLLDIVEATRHDPSLALGASTRAAIALARAARVLAAMEGRSFVAPEDIKALAIAVFWKRVTLRPDAMVRGVDVRSVLEGILRRTRVPTTRAGVQE